MTAIESELSIMDFARGGLSSSAVLCRCIEVWTKDLVSRRSLKSACLLGVLGEVLLRMGRLKEPEICRVDRVRLERIYAIESSLAGNLPKERWQQAFAREKRIRDYATVFKVPFYKGEDIYSAVPGMAAFVQAYEAEETEPFHGQRFTHDFIREIQKKISEQKKLISDTIKVATPFEEAPKLPLPYAESEAGMREWEEIMKQIALSEKGPRPSPVPPTFSSAKPITAPTACSIEQNMEEKKSIAEMVVLCEKEVIGDKEKTFQVEKDKQRELVSDNLFQGFFAGCTVECPWPEAMTQALIALRDEKKMAVFQRYSDEMWRIMKAVPKEEIRSKTFGHGSSEDLALAYKLERSALSATRFVVTNDSGDKQTLYKVITHPCTRLSSSMSRVAKDFQLWPICQFNEIFQDMNPMSFFLLVRSLTGNIGIEEIPGRSCTIKALICGGVIAVEITAEGGFDRIQRQRAVEFFLRFFGCYLEVDGSHAVRESKKVRDLEITLNGKMAADYYRREFWRESLPEKAIPEGNYIQEAVDKALLRLNRLDIRDSYGRRYTDPSPGIRLFRRRKGNRLNIDMSLSYSNEYFSWSKVFGKTNGILFSIGEKRKWNLSALRSIDETLDEMRRLGFRISTHVVGDKKYLSISLPKGGFLKTVTIILRTDSKEESVISLIYRTFGGYVERQSLFDVAEVESAIEDCSCLGSTIRSGNKLITFETCDDCEEKATMCPSVTQELQDRPELVRSSTVDCRFSTLREAKVYLENKDGSSIEEVSLCESPDWFYDPIPVKVTVEKRGEFDLRVTFHGERVTALRARMAVFSKYRCAGEEDVQCDGELRFSPLKGGFG